MGKTQLDSGPIVCDPASLADGSGTWVCLDSVRDHRGSMTPGMVGALPDIHGHDVPIRIASGLTDAVEQCIFAGFRAARFDFTPWPSVADLQLQPAIERFEVHSYLKDSGASTVATTQMAFRVSTLPKDSVIWTGTTYGTQAEPGQATVETGVARTVQSGAMRNLITEFLTDTTFCGSIRRFQDRRKNQIDSIGVRKFSAVRLGLEFYYGAGGYSDLSHLASADTLRATHRFTTILRLRISPYFGPLGLHVRYDVQFEPGLFPFAWPRDMPDDDGYFDRGHYTLLGIMPSMSISLFHGRLRLEPQAGYQWMYESTHSDYFTDGPPFNDPAAVRSRKAHFGGRCAALEQALVVAEGMRVRSTFAYGNLGGPDRRLTVEFQVGAGLRPASTHSYDRDFWGFLALGFQAVWRGDHRGNFAIYVGGGVW